MAVVNSIQLRDCILKIDPVTGRVRYRYNAQELVGEDCICEFGLLSEVGEYWVQDFKEIIQTMGLEIETVDDGLDYYERVKDLPERSV